MNWQDKAKTQVYRKLNRPGLRFLLAGMATVQASYKTRKPCRITYDGAWIQEFPNGTLVEPSLRLRVLPEIERTMRDMFMYQYLPAPGDIVVDIGAGSGWETLSFARLVGEFGQVIAVEAHPATFACLNEMCRRNRLRNVSTVHCAITGTDEAAWIGDSDHHTANSVFGATAGILVLGLTLDSLFRAFRLPRVDLLKINIEGAERPALNGMTRMIHQTRNVCIACHDFRAEAGDPEEMRTRCDVIRFLERNGFDVVLRTLESRPWIRDCVYGVNRNL